MLVRDFNTLLIYWVYPNFLAAALCDRPDLLLNNSLSLKIILLVCSSYFNLLYQTIDTWFRSYYSTKIELYFELFTLFLRKRLAELIYQIKLSLKLVVTIFIGWLIKKIAMIIVFIKPSLIFFSELNFFLR